MLVFNRRNVANLLLENSMVNILNISQKTLRGSCCSSFIKHQPIRNSFHKISFYIISKMLVNILLNFNKQDYFYNEKRHLRHESYYQARIEPHLKMQQSYKLDCHFFLKKRLDTFLCVTFSSLAIKQFSCRAPLNGSDGQQK